LANDDAYSKLATIAKELNQTIPAKEKCNEIRDLKKYNGHHYQVGVGDGSVYFKGVEFPVFNGSNSILSRQSRTEEYISNCLPNIDESIVFKLTLIIDSNGEVQNAEISNDCPERLREEILNCTKKMKWIPANNSTKKVRSKIQLLIGLNTNDKFEAWENISKSIQKNNHLGSRNGKILKQNLGSKNNEPEHIFNLVEEMPKLVDENALEKITNQLAAINPSKSISMIIRLVVEKNGSVSDVVVLRSNIGDLDEQTKSLILDNIKYSPGKQRGKPVRVQVIEKLNSK